VNTATGVGPLLTLAKSRDPTDREQLLSRLVQICETQEAAHAPRARLEIEAVFMALVADAERDIRARLAERLARAEWAPPQLILMLAHDDIEVARPVIAASPLLDDLALICLLNEATSAHHIEVAQRPKLSARVVEAVIDRGEPAVLTALAGNHTADITHPCMARLVEHARRIKALGEPLAEHPRMSAALASALYLWVGQALRSAIVARFEVDTAALDAALTASMTAPGTDAPERPKRKGPTAGELKLIDKLAEAGQLKPGYLIKALKDGQLGLFKAALAKLGAFPVEDVLRAVTHSARPDLLGLACCAVGIDRSAFPAILEMVRGLTDGLPGGGADSARKAASAFNAAPDIAAIAFSQAVCATV
jgi:uncharacterized protein (DUF2336 family)